MPYSDWRPGLIIASPAYLDSGFLIAALVRGDSRYQQATTIIGDLLINEVEVVISALTVSETLWGIAKLSYCDLFNHPYRTQFNPTVYHRHHTAIFERYGSRMGQVHDTLRDWIAAGVSVHVVPITVGELQQTARTAPEYMHSFDLASADAVHLALAESKANALITVDSEFQRVTATPLQIVHIER